MPALSCAQKWKRYVPAALRVPFVALPFHVKVIVEADAPQQRERLRVRFLRAPSQHLDLPEVDVVDDPHVREHLEALEHHADLRPQPRQVGAGVADRDAVAASLVDRQAAAVVAMATSAARRLDLLRRDPPFAKNGP